MSTNGFDPALVKRFMGDIIRHKEELLSLKGEYMQRAKGVHELAKEAGIPRKELNTLLKKIDLEAKLNGLIEDLDDDEQVNFDALQIAFGDFADTPLAAAALDRADKRSAKNKSDLDNLAI
jgi:hypothetical protein